MRAGKIPVVAAADYAHIATPDNANYVMLYFESDTFKLVAKNSAGTLKKYSAD